ncbi:MAG: hypothetical protein JW929_03925 [Anaerolineales bacterium]|nr:hypothetical protein [Anaerolineales bacterium]
MNEEFLARCRKSPRPEFAEELFRRISRPAPKTGLGSTARAALAAFFVCAALGLTLLASPAARAAGLALLRDIGGVAFIQTADYPGGDNPAVVPDEIMSLEQAQAELPFAIHLPAWVPAGYVRDSGVRILRFSADCTPATITWHGVNLNDLLELTIVQSGRGWIAGSDELETVRIHGRDAALVRGMWNADAKEWDAEAPTGLALYWSMGDTTYILCSPTLPRKDLIRIAESIP